ncbi:YiiX/YebB-like N1pC/P60 family cysteine hydrolase [Salinicola sp. CPA57]|uniref:YiiX/YebB-like N1pC/P60 family cysteine hydrolase n=1 Tax=Salinicola sp. CPA57 TaxID=1949080 RepID=UPI000DA18CB7|nr:YiiX/YebB-like N1pC/P60 family cysteine hydrolase [Salinicola sp. CPA57]
MKYILDFEKLVPGDIILESGNSKFSPVIKTITDSIYSHAMIYVGHSIIHALTDGVYSTNPQRVLTDDPKGLKVLRLKSPLTEQARNTVVNYARNLSGSIYSVPEASLSAVLGKTRKSSASRQQFCSRLVAHSYRQIGVSIANNPDYCTPEDINRSAKLNEITGVLKPADEQEVAFAESDNPIRENQRRMFLWLNQTREVFAKRKIEIQTESDVASFLMKNNDLDGLVCEFIKDSEYLEHYDYDKDVNPHRYEIKALLEKCSSAEHALEVFFGEINKEPSEIARHSNSYFLSGLNFIHLGLEYHKLHKQLYRNLLLMSHDRLVVLCQLAEIFRQPKLAEYCNYQTNYIQRII